MRGYNRRKGEALLTELAKFDPAQAIEIPKQLYDDGFIVIRNRGDSMEKLIMDGASVVIDISSREIVSGSIYALSIPKEGCILRECHSGSQGLLLRPYNRNYPVSVLGWDEFDPDMVVGRVFCSVINVFR
jgi:phage repressor protein C with HTH and peptisase S24 domain